MSRLQLDNSINFLTTSIVLHKPLMADVRLRQIVLDRIKAAAKKFNLGIYAYSIVFDHYHLVFYLAKGFYRQQIVQYINGGSSYLINKLKVRSGRVWDRYYHLYVEPGEELRRVVGYVHGNPLKHMVVKNFGSLAEYQFCSFRTLAASRGIEYASEVVREMIDLNYG
jgi:REP element-mobilizing transposase RayT